MWRAIVKVAVRCCSSLALVFCAVPVFAEDYAALSRQIAEMQHHLEQLESGQFDRSGPQLVEPLIALAHAHMRANQFDQADQLLDRGVQIVRFNHGLYAAAQYDLRQMSVENNLNRDAWTKINPELDHLHWLYTEKFSGSAGEQIERLSWLGDIHVQGILQDQERQVAHLRSATGINIQALSIALTDRRVPTSTQVELLYDLVLKIYLETQAIRGGGRTSYELREVKTNSPFEEEQKAVEERKDAIHRRYSLGLATLNEIKRMLAANGQASAETLAMVDLHIRDWHRLFNGNDD